ncbi:hypothetical protein GCM10010483_25730 [Actinokineospora diospyrosa]
MSDGVLSAVLGVPRQGWSRGAARAPGTCRPLRYRRRVAEDLESRVAALEDRLRALDERVRASERDAAAARVLAGGADRDVSEIRTDIRDLRQATTSSFNAMREDLHDLHSNADDSMAALRGKLDALSAGQEQITSLLTRLIERED